MEYEYIEIGNKNLTLYMRVCFDALKKNNEIRLKAYGNNISKTIYISNILKNKFDGKIENIAIDTKASLSCFLVEIICNKNVIQEKFDIEIFNKCKKCNEEIKTNEMYKSIDVYCKKCLKS